MTLNPPQHDQVLAGIATVLASQGLDASDLTDYLGRHGGGTPALTALATTVPTVRELVARVERALPENTRRTWRTHYRRLMEGVPPQCDCLCDACLDIKNGCKCGCARCGASRLGIEGCADLRLEKGSVRKSDVEVYASVAERLSAKKATRENRVRAARGLSPKPVHGKGGRENAVTAYRHLFGVLVDDELWDKNPATPVRKPQRDDPKRRSMHDHELAPFIDAVVSGGDDPGLDLLVVWFHLETGARRAGAIEQRLSRIRPATQMIELFEKGKKAGEQPVSQQLIEALYVHAAERGGPACDPTHSSYDPTRPVFYYGIPRAVRHQAPDGTWVVDRVPAPLTSRRYDTLFKRLQLTLPWANEISLTNHAVRRTGASIIERIAGNQTARAFLRHGPRTVTDTYTQATMERLAQAVSIYTGAPHPLGDRRT